MRSLKIEKMNQATYFVSAFISTLVLISFGVLLYGAIKQTQDVLIAGIVLFCLFVALNSIVTVIFIFIYYRQKVKSQYLLMAIFLSIFQIIPITPIVLLYFSYRLTGRLESYELEKSMGKDKPIVEIENLELAYAVPNSSELKRVIRGVSLKLYEGSVLAIIGESGSGKSVLTSTIYGQAGKNAVIQNGRVKIGSHDVTKWNESHWSRSGIRGNYVSAVFQNPLTTLNPTQKIGVQVMEGMIINNKVGSRKEAKERAIELLKKTRIPRPREVFHMYPHELSGGMKQRVVIAAILATRPKVLVLDEPTTALDPTIQAQVLEMVKDLRKEFNLSIIFITHDLGVVASLADRIAIMYAGKIVEEGNTKEVMLHSQHPYTWGLITSMPDLNVGNKLKSIVGSVPSTLNNVSGDAFAPRNPYALQKDYEEHPPFFKVTETHKCASWLLHEKAPKFDPPIEIIDRWNRWTKEVSNYDPNSHLKNYVFDKKKRIYIRNKDYKRKYE